MVSEGICEIKTLGTKWTPKYEDCPIQPKFDKRKFIVFSLFEDFFSLNLTKTNEALGPLIKTGLVPKIIQKTREQTLVYISVSKSAVIQQFSVGISERMLHGESNLRKRFY